MKRTLLLLLAAAAALPSHAAEPLKLTRTIPLPGVEGRIDHLSVDLAGQRLFVAALGNNTLSDTAPRGVATTAAEPGTPSLPLAGRCASWRCNSSNINLPFLRVTPARKEEAIPTGIYPLKTAIISGR